MNIKEIFLVSFIFLSLSVLGLVLTFNTFSNLTISEILAQEVTQPKITTSQRQKCNEKEPLELATATNPLVTKLAEYQEICGSFVTNEVMIFTQMPSTPERAVVLANDLTTKLQALSISGITPIVISEPTDNDIQLSFSKFKTGAYTPALVKYFATLKANGITDQQMGMWVPFPEANVPYWNHDNALPEDFGTNVSIFLNTMKATFPQAKGSILLNSVTYAPEDKEWANGNYQSLIPYVRSIDKKVIDSIGVQGFPWMSPNNPEQPALRLFTASKFLGTDFAIELGEFMNKKDIWFNTGTFKTRYADQPQKKVSVSVGERKAIFKEINAEIKRAQDDRFRVKVNIFAEDKSTVAEATDWSYLATEEEKSLIQEVISDFETLQIPIALYDIKK
jgi:hypothetical protein